jgi:hypothetical protein
VSRAIRGIVRGQDASVDTEIIVVGEKGNAQLRRDLASKISYAFVELNKV